MQIRRMRGLSETCSRTRSASTWQPALSSLDTLTVELVDTNEPAVVIVRWPCKTDCPHPRPIPVCR
jgi:hypothetical protein